jgi:hypothetical protein
MTLNQQMMNKKPPRHSRLGGILVAAADPLHTSARIKT